jgi:hypothetical protein
MIAVTVIFGWPAAAAAQEFTEIPVVVTRIALELLPDYKEGSLSGSAQLTVQNVLARPVTRIPLQLHRLMTFSEVRDESGRALQFKQDVVRYTDNPRLQVLQAVITLGQPLPPGAAVTLGVKWGGFLTPYTETGSNYVRDRVDTTFTIVRDDARAFPTVSVPTRAVNRATPTPDFEFSLRMTVPRGLVVAAGGRLDERVEQYCMVKYVYRSTIKVPFLNIAVAPYRLLEQDGLRIYYFPADSAGAVMVAEAARNALHRLAAWFGPMAGQPDFAVMEIPDGYGSQADLGAGIIQTAGAFRDRRQLGQLYHELSHLGMRRIWTYPPRAGTRASPNSSTICSPGISMPGRLWTSTCRITCTAICLDLPLTRPTSPRR